MRGISLHAAQLFVIALENILRGGCGQFNEISLDRLHNIPRLFGPCPDSIKAEEKRRDVAGFCVPRAAVSAKQRGAEPEDGNHSEALVSAC